MGGDKGLVAAMNVVESPLALRTGSRSSGIPVPRFNLISTFHIVTDMAVRIAE